MATTTGNGVLQAGHDLPRPSSTVEVAKQQGTEALKDIFIGSTAGAIGKIIEYPFDTVKVRLQSQPDGVPLRYSGPLDCFRQSLAQDGFLGIYRGLSAPIVGAAVETSCLFLSYRLAQQALLASGLTSSQPLTMPWLFACGAASGAATSLALTPIELVKCRMQVPREARAGGAAAPGAWAIIRSIHRHGGVLGFWHGQLGTLIRESGGSAAWFGSYEGVTAFFEGLRSSPLAPTGAVETPPLPVWQQLLAGACAGMSYNFILYPADTIKSRMQTEDVFTAKGPRKGFSSIGRAIWKEHGLRGLYRGCGITVARSAPSSAVIFTIYEALKRQLG